MLNSKLRVLLYATRRNWLAALGQVAIFAFMGFMAFVIPTATVFNVTNGVGFGVAWVDITFGVFFAVLILGSLVSIVFNNVERAKRYLRVEAEQSQGFVYPLEEYEERMQAAANRRAGLAAEQLALF